MASMDRSLMVPSADDAEVFLASELEQGHPEMPEAQPATRVKRIGCVAAGLLFAATVAEVSMAMLNGSAQDADRFQATGIMKKWCGIFIKTGCGGGGSGSAPATGGFTPPPFSGQTCTVPGVTKATASYSCRGNKWDGDACLDCFNWDCSGVDLYQPCKHWGKPQWTCCPGNHHHSVKSCMTWQNVPSKDACPDPGNCLEHCDGGKTDPQCKQSSECPSFKPICAPGEGVCKKLTCDGAAMDGKWGDGAPWTGVTPMTGKYTINYFKYIAGAGCLCMFNDWIGTTEELCPDNYNYFQFKLKSGGWWSYKQETWELYLYGDETMKVLQDGSEVMTRGKASRRRRRKAGGLGMCGYGKTPNLNKKHTTYEICFPAGKDMELSSKIADPWSGGDYKGTCMPNAGEPNGIDVEVDDNGDTDEEEFVVPVCTKDSQCRRRRKTPVCVEGICSAVSSGIFADFTFSLSLSIQITTLIKKTSFKIAIIKAFAKVLSVDITMITVQLIALGSKLQALFGFSCGCSESKAGGWSSTIKKSSFFTSFKSKMKSYYSSYSLSLTSRVVSVSIFTSVQVMWTEINSVYTIATAGRRRRAPSVSTRRRKSTSSGGAALFIEYTLKISGSVTKLIKSSTFKSKVSSVMTLFLKSTMGISLTSVQYYLKKVGSSLVIDFGTGCGCSTSSANGLSTTMGQQSYMLIFAQNLMAAYSSLSIVSINLNIQVFSSYTLLVKEYSVLQITTTTESCRRRTCRRRSSDSRRRRRRKSSSPPRRRRRAPKGGRLLGEGGEKEDSMGMEEENVEQEKAEETMATATENGEEKTDFEDDEDELEEDEKENDFPEQPIFQYQSPEISVPLK